MSTVQLYCHECQEVVTAGSEEFSCPHCHGGFVELIENAVLRSGVMTSVDNSRSVATASDEDAPFVPLIFPSPFAPYASGASPSRRHRFAGTRDPNAARLDTNDQATASTNESTDAQPGASNALPLMPTFSLMGGTRPQATNSAVPPQTNPWHSRARPNLDEGSASASASSGATQLDEPAESMPTLGRQHYTLRRATYNVGQPRRFSATSGGGNFMEATVQASYPEDFLNAILRLSNAVVEQQAVGMGYAGAGTGSQARAAYVPFLQFAPFFALHGDPRDYVFSEQGIDDVITQLLGQLGGGPPPARPEILERLPDAHISSEQTQNGLQCFVCFEEFSKDEKVKRLPCGHHYHQDCILPWLQLHGTCPVCRKTLEGIDTSTYSHDHNFMRPPGEADAEGTNADGPSGTSTATPIASANGSRLDGDNENEQFYDAPNRTESPRNQRRPPDYFS